MTTDLLGPAESYVASKLREDCEKSIQVAEKLLEGLRMALDQDFEAAMIDSGSKEALISVARMMTALPERLQLAEMVTIILVAATKEKP